MVMPSACLRRFRNHLSMRSRASSAVGRNLTTNISVTGTGETFQPVRATRATPADRNDAAPPQADDVGLPISLCELTVVGEITSHSTTLQHLFSVFISATTVEGNACRRPQRHVAPDANPTESIEVVAPTPLSSD